MSTIILNNFKAMKVKAQIVATIATFLKIETMFGSHLKVEYEFIEMAKKPIVKEIGLCQYK